MFTQQREKEKESFFYLSRSYLVDIAYGCGTCVTMCVLAWFVLLLECCRAFTNIW